MKHIYSFCAVCCLILPLFSLPQKPAWSAVTAGNLLCEPIVHNGYIYTLTADHALNCLDSRGSFVWRRTVARTKEPFLTAGRAGILVIADRTGTVQAVSAQGILLWERTIPEALLYAPFVAENGNILILTGESLYCLSMKGGSKWALSLSAPPVLPLCGVGGTSVALILQNNEYWLIQLTGTVIRRVRLQSKPSLLCGAGNGCLITTADGSTAYYPDAGLDVSAAWQIPEQPAPLFLKGSGSTVLFGYSGGRLSLRSLVSGAEIWTITLGSPILGPLHCRQEGNEYYLSCGGFAAAVTSAGKIKWETAVPHTDVLPLIHGEAGLLLCMQEWVIHAYRMETPIRAAAVPADRGSELPYRTRFSEHRTVPFFFGESDTQELFSEIQAQLESGLAAEKEDEYSVYLAAILQNKGSDTRSSKGYSIPQRASAAVLLGKFESLEYRELLLQEAETAEDSYFAQAIIEGLGIIAADPDGRSVQAIMGLVRRCGTLSSAPAYTAADALTEIIRYGGRYAAEAAVKGLAAISSGAFPENTKRYARQKLKTIVR